VIFVAAMELDDDFAVFDSYVPLPGDSSGSSSGGEESHRSTVGSSDSMGDDDDDDEDSYFEESDDSAVSTENPEPVPVVVAMKIPRLSVERCDDLDALEMKLQRRERHLERRRETFCEEQAELKRWEDSQPRLHERYNQAHRTLLLRSRLDKRIELNELLTGHTDAPDMNVYMPDVVAQAIEEERRDLRDPELVRCLTRHLNTGLLFEMVAKGEALIYTMDTETHYVIAGVTPETPADNLFFFVTRKDALII